MLTVNRALECTLISCFHSSLWWRPSLRMSSVFYFSVVVWWWSASSRWGSESVLKLSVLLEWSLQNKSVHYLLFTLLIICRISASSPQAVIVLYAFSRPFLLNEQIQISENQTFYKHHILEVIMRVPLMCFFATIFFFIFYPLVDAFYFCLSCVNLLNLNIRLLKG